MDSNNNSNLSKKNTIDIVGKFKDRTEKRLAKELLLKYLEDYDIETISDRNTLSELIYYEIIQSRLQDRLNKFYAEDSKAVPINIIEILHKNSDIIVKMKNTLGLNRAKTKDKPYDIMQHLIKRHTKWRDENQASRTMKCPHCKQFILLKMKVDAWEAQGHPFFKDNILYNKALFEKYYGKTIMIDDNFIAEVLETSNDYPEWIRKRRIDKTSEIIQTQEEDKSGTVQSSVSLLDSKETGQNVSDNKG